MNVAAPQTRFLRYAYRAYLLAFFVYLAAPLVALAIRISTCPLWTR